MHGMNGIAEGARLVRGATSVNHVSGLEHLVMAGTGVWTSGLVFGVDR